MKPELRYFLDSQCNADWSDVVFITKDCQIIWKKHILIFVKADPAKTYAEYTSSESVEKIFEQIEEKEGEIINIGRLVIKGKKE